jgi:DNA-binding response OmpR family regulator
MATTADTNHVVRILLVEDDNHIGRIIELVLPELAIPYEFVTVISAEEGLDLWKDRPFDVLLTDYNLRGMNGLSLIRELRARGHNPPTILVTAYDSADVRREAREMNVSDYLTKPFFMDDLLGAIRRLLPTVSVREVNGNSHA